MKTLISIALMTLSLAVLSAQHGMSHEEGRQSGRGRGTRNERMSRSHHCSMCQGEHGKHAELDLSEEQKNDIESLRMQHRLAVIDIQAETKKLGLQRRSHLSNGEFRQAKRIIEQYYNKRRELAQKRIELTESIYNLLDDDQKKAFLSHRNMSKPRK